MRKSLTACSSWDEDTYGLKYDLDLFNVVVVESFNMRAMENKSYVAAGVPIEVRAIPRVITKDTPPAPEQEWAANPFIIKIW